MSEPLAIEIDATHLYPGARGQFAGRAPASGATIAATLVFSDLARAAAVLRLDSPAARLDVEPYVTRAGTRIAAKAWAISIAPRGAGCAIRVLHGIAS